MIYLLTVSCGVRNKTFSLNYWAFVPSSDGGGGGGGDGGGC